MCAKLAATHVCIVDQISVIVFIKRVLANIAITLGSATFDAKRNDIRVSSVTAYSWRIILHVAFFAITQWRIPCHDGRIIAECGAGGIFALAFEKFAAVNRTRKQIWFHRFATSVTQNWIIGFDVFFKLWHQIYLS